MKGKTYDVEYFISMRKETSRFLGLPLVSSYTVRVLDARSPFSVNGAETVEVRNDLALQAVRQLFRAGMPGFSGTAMRELKAHVIGPVIYGYLAIIAALLAGIGGFIWLPPGRGIVHAMRERCARCGYALKGLPVVMCPECGHRATKRDAYWLRFGKALRERIQ